MLKNSVVKFTAMFICLVLLQVLVLNKISFLGYAIPFFYIYFIIKLPINLNRSLITFLGFLLGFSIDIFCSTPGINAAATTLIAFLNRPIQNMFFATDDYDKLEPRFSMLGAGFIKYVVVLVLMHNIALVAIESFSFFNLTMILYRVLLSTLITSILIIAFEGLSLKAKK